MEIKEQTTNRINILPPTLANKIAAGEVVERPASVVKELIENAIDAEAEKISVVLKQSGKELIQVVDDGQGMLPEDLELAFKRHATSKIHRDEDLERIETLGFRGEALPSIASVSQIRVKSREKEATVATELYLEGGITVSHKKTAGPVGTNIEIRNLFYNTPARRNFLRADTTELQQVVTVMKRFFLAYPDIEFEVINDDTQLFSLKSGDIERRLRDVFGEPMFDAMVKVHDNLGGIELSGFVSRPDNVRRSRGNQFLFLNGRPIQDKSLNHAVMKGYNNLIGPGEFPTFCLFLELDARLVDVNVHPTKMEVRFSNDRSLYYFFMTTIRKALNQENIIPKFSTGGNESEAFVARFDPEVQRGEIASELKSRNKFMARGNEAQLSLMYFDKTTPEPEQGEPAAPQQYSEPVPAQPDVDVRFWQIHNRYILSEIKSGMVIIDQHVAHERILFERILKILREGEEGFSQQLLFPQTLPLPVEDFLRMKEFLPLLDKIGFGIQLLSGNTILIDAIPVDVKIGRESQVLLDIVDYLKDGDLAKFDPLEKMSAAFSCKNAIKSGEPLTQAQMHALIDQLFACETPYFCPHGRPVIITMDLDEIDRKFKRIS
jgi:DNA mismatch repair protein MutL